MKRNFSRVLLFFMYALAMEAQYIEMNFTDPFKEITLSNNNANCITQDSLGFIWIGTKNGLNRFNGYENKVYIYDYSDSTSLLSQDIKLLYTDSKGRMWVGFRNGLCLYNASMDHFKRVAHPLDSCGLSNFDITNFAEDKSHNLYISNTEHIYIYDEVSETFKKIFKTNNGEIADFLFDGKENIWIGNFKNGGLVYYNRQSKKSTIYLHENKNPNSISDNSPVSLAMQGHKLWIATAEGGINCLDTYTGKFRNYYLNSEYEKYTTKVFLDNSNRLWSIDVTGLKLYDENNDNFFNYYVNENSPYSIKTSIVGIFQDFQNNYWTLHAGQGVGLSVPPKGFNFFDTTKERFWYLSFDHVSTVNEDGYGNLWIGNPSNGINIFKWSHANISVLGHDANNKNSLGPGTIHTIFRDSKNNMWVGVHRGGLQLYNPNTNQFKNYLHNPDDPSSIANNDVRSIAEDKDGNLWMVTHGNGIDKFIVNENKFIHFTSANSNLSNDWAFDIHIDKKNNIWVATVWGLSLFNHNTRKFYNFYHYSHESNSISSNEINCIYEDNNGGIWVGTTEGLNFFVAKDSTFKHYKHNFVNYNIGSILRDNYGKLWLGTMDGIAVFDTTTLFYRNFDQSDGLLANEIHPRSAYKNAGNNFYFGSVKGLIFFNPEQIKYNEKPPKVLVTRLKIFNEDVINYGKNSPLKENINITDRVVLDHTQKVFTLEYAAINYITPWKNKFKYKLEKFDKDWIDAGNKREVTYTNLDPGKYTFKVIASNNDGIWNNTGVEKLIIIRPPWWETIWFRFIVLVFIFILLFLIFLNRTRQLRNQKSILENLVKKRTRELIAKNDLLEKQTNDLNNINTLLEERQQHIIEQSEELKTQAEKLTLANNDLEQANSAKNKLFSIIAHDLKDPFNTILGFSDYLLDDFENVDKDDKIKMISAINTSSHRVHNLLDNLLKWARSQTHSIQLKKSSINVLKLVHNSYYVLKDNLINKKIELMYNIPEDLEIYVDENTMQTVLRNLINNAIKFTPAKGAINISAKKDMDSVRITISDSGIGMDQETLDNLFIVEKNKTLAGTEGEKGSGLGLLICKEFIELNNGYISVTSQPEKGSAFSINMPSLMA